MVVGGSCMRQKGYDWPRNDFTASTQHCLGYLATTDAREIETHVEYKPMQKNLWVGQKSVRFDVQGHSRAGWRDRR